MLRRLSISSTLCLLTGLLAASCTYDSPTLKEAYCNDDQQGTTRPDDNATCTDGFWVAPPENPDAGNPDAGNQDAASPNTCGGTAPLTHEPGTICGSCDLDKYECDESGSGTTTCSGNTPCPANHIVTEPAKDISAYSAILHATIKKLDEDDLPTEYGFCYKNSVDAEICTALAASDMPAPDVNVFQLKIENLLPGHKHTATAYHIARTKPGEKVAANPPIEFITTAPTPQNLTASKGEHSGHVALTWDKADGAIGYEVYQDNDLLQDLSKALDADDKTTLNDTTAAPGLLSFSTPPTASNDQYEHVQLTGSAATITPPTEHTYSVVALYPNATSMKSNEDTGFRKIGSINYQWMGSKIEGPDTEFDNLTGTTAIQLEHQDTQAPPDGKPRTYRLIANAPGASQATSHTVTGLRKHLVAPTNIKPTKNLSDKVTITWQVVEGAHYYTIFRDNQPIQSDITSLSYDDTQAAKPTTVSLKPVLTVSDNLSEHIKVSWTHPGDTKGKNHQYTVVAARNSGLTSPHSAPSVGYVLYTFNKYQYRKDSGSWAPVPASTQTSIDNHSFLDTSAKPPTITAGEIEIVDITTDNKVKLKLTTPAIYKDGPDTTYEVQAIYSNPSKHEESDAKPGKRVPLNKKHIWQTSNDSEINFENIESTKNKDEIVAQDTNPSEKYYRVRFSADGALPANSPPIDATPPTNP